MLPLLGILAATTGLAGCQPRESAPAFSNVEVAEMQALLQSRDFTPGSVTLIKSELRNTDPRNYRLVLPVFGPADATGRRAIVSSETIGKLPVTEVRRVASARRLEYKENANAQAIIFQNAEQGGNPGGGSPGGGSPAGGGQGGCEQDHSTPAHGEDIAARVENILRNINQSKYIFLY
jgi:hypothetical protein